MHLIASGTRDIAAQTSFNNGWSCTPGLRIGNTKNASTEKRQFHEEFTFRNREYSKDEEYYLVMKDATFDMELSRHEFIIDIAFADDFGFSL